MVKKRKSRKSKKHGKKRRSGYIPTYHAKRKKKQKMPQNVKNYFKCLNSGKSKKTCKAKFLK
jgi:hypothetical protein